MRSRIPPLQLAVRTAAAAVAALLVARSLALPFPVYAMIAAVMVTDLSQARTRELAWPRIAGTFIGAGLGACLSSLANEVWAVAGGVAAAIMVCHVLRLKDAAKLAAYLCGIVLLQYRDDPWAYALARLMETLLGIAVAVLVSLVPKLLGDAPLEKSRPP